MVIDCTEGEGQGPVIGAPFYWKIMAETINCVAARSRELRKRLCNVQAKLLEFRHSGRLPRSGICVRESSAS